MKVIEIEKDNFDVNMRSRSVNNISDLNWPKMIENKILLKALKWYFAIVNDNNIFMCCISHFFSIDLDQA